MDTLDSVDTQDHGHVGIWVGARDASPSYSCASADGLPFECARAPARSALGDASRAARKGSNHESPRDRRGIAEGSLRDRRGIVCDRRGEEHAFGAA